MGEIWIEKYRPRNFSEIKGQGDIVNRLEAFVKSKNMPHCIFAGPAGVGKCVSPDTIILDGKGNLLTIEQAYKNKISTVMSLDRDGKIREKRVAYFYKGFSKNMINVNTAFGNKLKVTPEHPFLIMKDGNLDWVQAKDLVKGDYATAPLKLQDTVVKKYNLKIPKTLVKKGDYYSYRNKSNLFSSEIKIPELNADFYYWLGLLFGDGNFKIGGISFYNNNKDLRENFWCLSRKLFGDRIEMNYVQDKCPFVQIKKATTIIKLLEENLDHGICCKKSHIIKVPKELFRSNKQNISAFIRGIYDTDGSFYGSCLEISSMSKEMLVGIKYLLLHFGIPSRIKKNRLLMSGSDTLKRFLRSIKPNVKKPINFKKNNTNLDIFTINPPEIKKLIKNFGITYDEIGGKLSGIIESGRGSRKRIKKFYNKLIELVRNRLIIAIEILSDLDRCENLTIEPERTINLLRDSEIRKNVKTEKYDSYRLREYYNKKRQPILSNYLSILRKLNELRLVPKVEYSNTVEIMSIRQKVLNALKLFKISYNEISKKAEILAANVNNFLNREEMLLESLPLVQQIIIVIKKAIKDRVYNEECMLTLENINFLKNADIIIDKITEIDKSGKCEVYDLNVEDVHNFIGGDSPLILHNTTSALIMAKELFRDTWKGNFLELNASDDRGIDVVRHTIKDFARTMSLGDVPFKIIMLDEADALTKDAQQALRRTMENYSNTCRFILSCNYSSKLIDPIQSRCAVFRFKPIKEEEIVDLLKEICKKEKMKINDKALKVIFDVSNGDIRKAENILQSAASLGKEVNEKVIYQIVSAAEPREVKGALESAVNGNFIDARKKLLDTMLKHGLAGIDIIKQIQKEIWNLEIKDENKLKMVEKCGEVEFRMVEGSDEYLQLEALLSSFVLVGKR
jgi:replication factor C small subunit